MSGIDGDRATHTALSTESAAIDHLGEPFQFFFIQFLRAEDLGPQAVLAADKGLKGLNFSSRINLFLTPLSIDRAIFQAFAAASAGIDLD